MPNNFDHKYLDLAKDVLTTGNVKGDRTGTGTLSKFGAIYRHDLKEGLPVLTTKKVHLKSVIVELLWFLRGDTNIKFLKDHGVSIWDEWATEDGELGPVYGAQWRKWKNFEVLETFEDGTVRAKVSETDQVAELVEGLKNNPNSRRHIINGWNVSYLPLDSIKDPVENARQGKMALPPCHVLYQFYVHDGKLSAMLTQRSADLFLGVPFNTASLAILTHMLAHQCDLEPGEIVHSFGDHHLYSNHLDQIKEQLSRTPFDSLPTLKFKRKPPSIFDYNYDDFEIENYQSHSAIKAPVAK